MSDLQLTLKTSAEHLCMITTLQHNLIVTCGFNDTDILEKMMRIKPFSCQNNSSSVFLDIVLMGTHCNLKVLRSRAKIYENFANYFLKTEANRKCFIVLKCTCKGLKKSMSELER